jgi:hypothetical protein
MFYAILPKVVYSSYFEATKDNVGDILVQDTMKIIQRISSLWDHDAAMDISLIESNKPTCLNVHGE